ncbi:hypothetical protein ACFPN2_25270 [Steroidobacter flavus]|uniref:Uncharacterized protein n=1 Tax=Steroidobacter flavus TaxID=1842136 RepID=A0ABV8T162_9GAMM
MLIGLAALEGTDWTRLHHAYGRATDTPDHLRALLGENSEARKEALEHLWTAIIHQGTLFPATAPVARVIAGLLTDARLDRGESIRPELLAFLAAVPESLERVENDLAVLERQAAFDLEPFLDAEDIYEAIFENEDAVNSFGAQATLACIAAAPILMDAMLQAAADGDAICRMHASKGVVKFAKVESLRHRAAELESQLLALARETSNSDERSAYVLAVGELGYSPTTFLSDSSPAVRMCAALAPSLSTDERAIKELFTVLEAHAGDIDGWFAERPPQFSRRPRIYVVQRLIQQVRDFDRLANAAIAVARVTNKGSVEYEWGPLLIAAFPKRNGVIETDAQRRYLRALVENADLWDPKFGNASACFKRLNLPYDRDACARLVQTS